MLGTCLCLFSPLACVNVFSFSLPWLRINCLYLSLLIIKVVLTSKIRSLTVFSRALRVGIIESAELFVLVILSDVFRNDP